MKNKELALFSLGLVICLKNRSENDVLFFLKHMTSLYTVDELENLVGDLVSGDADYDVGLTDEDVDFYFTVCENFLAEEDAVVEKNDDKLEVSLDQKYSDVIKLFEERGLVLGVDYSFHEGDILMRESTYDSLGDLITQLT